MKIKAPLAKNLPELAALEAMARRPVGNASPAALLQYKTLHLWLLLPMFFMQLGIFRDYWGDFTDNAWSVHVHYWTGTAWYLFLIIQPYFATHGQLHRHRTWGIIGMFMAGAVSFTALSMLHRDIQTAELAAVARERFGPFEPWFFYGVAAVEIVMMTAFGLAVVMSILHRKQFESHAWWLISTVFIIMMPALGRGIQVLWVVVHIRDFPHIDIMAPLYLTQVLIIGMVLAGAWKYRKLQHPATYLAIGINLFVLLLEPLGRSESAQHLLKLLIKG
ncbi:hypothetical protein [Cesiribacter andamanensis]|uniref:Uncharacterized protein n=1 Tax=Cesiribacter andamanensis AMV16 TaxID=1279009 RepID=M7N2B1_9BACT|nr:hypothetical protein [Cesiribacter andamanensis]EMR01346.1 hypothetical protein ADICEAN_03526 [Cesiribacter andamanensis AMV16]